MQSLIGQYFSWHFLEMPKNILAGWKNFLKFGLNYFSIPLLFRTLFSPWHKYVWFYPRGFDFGKYLEVFFSNLISRFIGMILRIFFIFFGVLTEIFILFLGIFFLFVWLILPLLLIAGLIFGFKLLI